MVRILRDAVYPATLWGTVQVQLRVRQPVARQVRGIRDADVRVRGVRARSPACPWHCSRIPARLSRAADAHRSPLSFPPVVTVMPCRAVQVLAL